MNKIIQLVALISVSAQLFAQNTLPVPLNIKAAYQKDTRSKTGAPGKRYWQNAGNYDIRVNVEPVSRTISGEVLIQYTNNSPDTLREIVFKLYPNIYKTGAPRLTEFDAADINEGIRITRLQVNGEAIAGSGYRISSTNMNVRVKPIMPGATTHISINYSYILNKGSHMRTGEIEPGALFVAYFFPRIAVYDDIDGWNRNPYLGTQEFYNDFCDFTLSISVPSRYTVWATGDLVNADTLLSAKYLQRLRQAERLDGYIDVIDSTDIPAGGITNNKGINTWIFRSQHVTDAVFAISDHYRWQSTSLIVDSATGRRTRVDAVFNDKHHDYFHVVSDARKTVEAMSFRFPRWPYPYPHITVFDGLDQMEYPMMVNDNPVEDRFESIELTDHEIFHTIFPFYMGINETKYGWMDEGWATIGEWLISPMIDSNIVDDYGMTGYERAAGTENDLPIMTLTTQLFGLPMFINSYPKPALGYLYVKDLLGDELFFRALHHYIRSWNGKHPMPYDFFYSMNAGSGKNLDWFWKSWFFDSGVPDLAIKKLSERGSRKTLLIEKRGSKPVPVDVTLMYTDGSSEKIHRSIGVWEKGNREISLVFSSIKKIRQVTLGSTYIPDVHREDNILMVK